MSQPRKTHISPRQQVAVTPPAQDMELLVQAALLEHLITSVPCVVLVVNEQRQVVFQNKHLLEALGVANGSGGLGLSPGEILECTHVAGILDQNACCSECGTYKAVLRSQSERVAVVGESRIIAADGSSHDFTVRAAPYTLGDRTFTLISLLDISDRNRRAALDRVLFHDINNILTGIMGFCDLLDSPVTSGEYARAIDLIRLSSQEIVQQLLSHQQIVDAEDGHLSLNVVEGFSSRELMEEILMMARRTWPHRSTVQGLDCADVVLTTDRALLYRILYNMVKNAEEASEVGEEIALSCRSDLDAVIFSVHNPSYIPESIQPQVFRRSFSTKGGGRGMGTYSIRLFGETYLKGRVWFTSTPEGGTTFHLWIPRVHLAA